MCAVTCLESFCRGIFRGVCNGRDVCGGSRAVCPCLGVILVGCAPEGCRNGGVGACCWGKGAPCKAALTRVSTCSAIFEFHRVASVGLWCSKQALIEARGIEAISSPGMKNLDCR